MKEAEEQFLDDITEVLNTLEEHLLSLETDSFNKELYDAIFRELHTVKGSLFMFDRKELGDLAHEIESVYEELNEANHPFTPDIIQISLNSVDFIRENLGSTRLEVEDLTLLHSSLIKAIKASADEALKDVNINKKKKEVYTRIHLIVFKPKIALKKEDGHPVHFIIRDLLEETKGSEFIIEESEQIKEWRLLLMSEMEQAELAAQFLFIEDDFEISFLDYPLKGADEENIDLELFQSKLSEENLQGLQNDLEEFSDKLSEPVETTGKEDSLEELKDEVAKGKSTSRQAAASNYIKVEREKIDNLMNWVSELVTMQATLQNQAEKFNSEVLRNVSDNMEFITENLRDTIFSVSLVPLKTLETRFTRLVHDLSLNLEKKVNFKSEGFDTELDKKVISELTDPLLHILRNCIDHGIEKSSVRKERGKPEAGTILLNSYYSGNLVIIEIEDDGNGIDPSVIRKKAIENGLIMEDDDYSDEEIIQFIFHPGFSTAKEISDVSGRGVGMDVVRRKIQNLRGEVMVSSEKGEGTKTVIKIPLSLSILEGLLTKVGTTNLVLPLNTIREIHRIPRQEFYNRPEGSDLLEIEGRQLPVVSLENKFEIESSESRYVDIITIDTGYRQKGVAVDEIKGQVKAVLKPLSDYYKEQDFISGGTILGDGSLAFVLDMEKIIN